MISFILSLPVGMSLVLVTYVVDGALILFICFMQSILSLVHGALMSFFFHSASTVCVHAHLVVLGDNYFVSPVGCTSTVHVHIAVFLVKTFVHAHFHLSRGLRHSRHQRKE